MSESAAGRFDFQKETLGHLLRDRKLAVPIYQRSYAWEKAEVAEYWNDLRPSAAAHPTSEYFIGSVVLSKSGVSRGEAVIDGQQRLATTALLLAAIRDEFRERGEIEDAARLERKYLLDEDFFESTQNPNLRLNAEDHPFFQARIIEGKAVDPSRTSHERIQTAYLFLRDKVKGDADSSGSEWKPRLKGWVEFLEKGLRVIAVEVPTEADAFLIFETLNDRGADLTIADLLKNYLFGRSDSEIETVRNHWISALTALDLTAESATFTTFLRHAWSSRYGRTRERDLFTSIKERVKGSAQALEAAEFVQESSKIYAGLMDGGHLMWANLGGTAQQAIDVLKLLGLEQIRPLQLAVFQYFSAKEQKKALRAFVGWGVRGIVVGGIGAGSSELAYCRAAVKVRSGEIKSVEELRLELENTIPADDLFKEAFKVKSLKKRKMARYILRALEYHQTGKEQPEFVPNPANDQITLEHIMPLKDPDGNWSHIEPEVRRSYLWRFGNLCLLPSDSNGALGSDSWSEKKPVLETSSYHFTRLAGESIAWDTVTIEQNQAAMAAIAILVWPR